MSTDHTPDGRIADIAGRQAGCVSRAQALEAGVTDNMIRHRLSTTRWLRLHPGVYRIGGTEPSWRQDVWAAALSVGPQAVVSHHSALLLHGLQRGQAPRYPITLSVPAGQHHRVARAKVHQTSYLPADHLTELGGLRTVSIERAVVDLAAVTKSHAHVGKILDRFIADGRTTSSRVGRCFDDLARPGRRGVRLVAAVLDERGPGYVPPASELERRLFDVIERARLPEPLRQLPLPGRGKVEGLADSGYLDARLLLEADGRRWHTRLEDFRADRERDAEASRAGWLTLRFAYEQLKSEPHEVGGAISATRAIRLQQLAGCT